MEPVWSACTLPTAEQPLRVAEFETLLARSLAVRRPAPTVLEFDLPAEARAEVDDLTARESACCSFFRFETRQAEHLLLRIEVPPAHTAVLDALGNR